VNSSLEVLGKINSFQDAFISYGRADSKAFATKLYDRLLKEGLKVWFDQNDIPLGVDYQNQIDDGIEKADNFLFLIAPHSVNSPYCRKEIELALRRNKRIIPLLHVEQIIEEIWQQRNPGRDSSEWETYKSKGLHSSFPNMHPVIGKINWVYFREGIDDFEKSFAGLLEIFTRHRDYVQQHTYFLGKSLEWERNQKQSPYLLTGEERIQAESWLKIRFKDEQPPCEPTDLHCAFIGESTKNANNLMTDVFLSYSEKERTFMEKVANSLRRECFTVWTNLTDINSGSDFVEAIYRGLEEADNVVYLMSPASVASPYCQMELAHARMHKKRIIPVLIKEVELEQVPPELSALQFITIADTEQESQYHAAIAKLIKVLREDAAYHEQHKIVLAKAVKWERQKRNPSILLRGYNLRQAEAWLKVAKQRTQHSSTPLQEEFIAESLKQPPDASLDVFIAYSRTDSDFARKLNETLQIQGKTTWFEQESIASGVDFQQEIQRGIEYANNFLFIISPNSVNSPDSAAQVEYAMSLNKRIVPVLYQEVDPATLHPGLGKVQWVDFRKHGGDFLTNFGELTRTLDTDPEYLRTHTRLLLKAKEWEQQGRDDGFLLRGKDLVASQQWLTQTINREPAPTDLQLEYLAASRELPYRRVKRRTVMLTGLAVTALVFAGRFFGLMQPVELAAYDHLLRLRPSEPKDDRLVIVGVDVDSAEMIDRSDRYRLGRGTVPDLALSDTLKALNRHQPRLIGLDFIRDFISLPELTQTFKDTTNLVAVCKGSATNDRGQMQKGNKAPTNVSIERVGFANLQDDGGKFLRRHYLMAGADPDYCNTMNAFSLILTQKYLEGKGIAYSSPFDPKEEDFVRHMQFGKTVIPPLWAPTSGNGSGYRDRGDQLGGYQAMLNYRIHQGDPEKFVPIVPLKDVLENRVPAELIRDRIVLIGMVDKAERQADYWNTPYGEVPGVVLHAQMISQLLSATLDGRPLIWWMPMWSETLWIFGWSVVGGFVVWWFRQPKFLAIAGVASVVSLYGICYFVLAFPGGWLPLAPALIALMGTGAGVGCLNYYLRK
jgi:CHASE2 domain-containing sensor protein